MVLAVDRSQMQDARMIPNENLSGFEIPGGHGLFLLSLEEGMLNFSLFLLGRLGWWERDTWRSDEVFRLACQPLNSDATKQDEAGQKLFVISLFRKRCRRLLDCWMKTT